MIYENLSASIPRDPPKIITVFSKLNMNMEFHQIELEERSRDIATFSAGDSLYHYKRLSFACEQCS